MGEGGWVGVHDSLGFQRWCMLPVNVHEDEDDEG